MSYNLASVWTEDRLTDLTRLWTEGLSITQIGLALGVSRNAVVGKVHRMGLPKRQSPIVKSDKPRVPKAPIERRRTVPLSLEQWDRNRSEERRGGKECVRTCWCRGWPYT